MTPEKGRLLLHAHGRRCLMHEGAGKAEINDALNTLAFGRAMCVSACPCVDPSDCLAVVGLGFGVSAEECVRTNATECLAEVTKGEKFMFRCDVLYAKPAS